MIISVFRSYFGYFIFHIVIITIIIYTYTHIFSIFLSYGDEKMKNEIKLVYKIISPPFICYFSVELRLRGYQFYA